MASYLGAILILLVGFGCLVYAAIGLWAGTMARATGAQLDPPIIAPIGIAVAMFLGV
jgi:hypothetical protein